MASSSASWGPFALAKAAGQLTGVSEGPRRRAFGDVVVLSVPWPNIDAVLAEAGPLAGKVVIDTTNHFTSAGLAGLGEGTAAQVNQAPGRPGAVYGEEFS